MLAALKAAERRRVSTPYRKLEAMKEEEKALAHELEQLESAQRRKARRRDPLQREPLISDALRYAPAGAQSFMAPWLEKRGEGGARHLSLIHI